MEKLECLLDKKLIWVNKASLSSVVYFPKLCFSAITDFTITKARSRVITFSTPITMIYHSIFINNPADSINMRSYIDTLTDMAWLVIFSFFLGFGIVIFVCVR